MTSGDKFIIEAGKLPRALVEKYIENRKKELPKLKSAIEEKDFDTLRRIGHNLKGSGLSYGVAPISEIGERLEVAALSKDLDGTQSAIAEIEAFISRIEFPE